MWIFLFLRILLRALLKGCTLLNLILFINQISIFNYNFIRMKNTVSFQRKGISIAMKCFTSIFYFFLFSLSSLAACVDKEPVDEEDVDPAINPPITFVEDDEEGNNEGITGGISFLYQ